MLPVDTKIWGHRVPGYIPDSSDEEEDDSEEEDFLATTEERLNAVIRTLGPRYVERPVVDFSPVSLNQQSPTPQPSAVFTPAVGNHAPPLFSCLVHAPIVAKTFYNNGCLPTTTKDWTVQWGGPGMKDPAYQALNEYQRVNHFPGSTELTRKDRLWTHFQEMKQAFGSDSFDFVPDSFVLPEQVDLFLDCYERTDYTWIVKPNNGAQGDGIFLLKELEDLPMDQATIVSRYVDDPLLIQGLKFDLRIYVLVTSYTPLCAYVYREGLVRFASAPYSNEPRYLKDAYRHLTNYSVNKTAHNFVENQESEQDNVGHKWSLSALNKHLECVGINVDLMWARIMDMFVKTLLSVEPSIANKTRSLTVHNNCFECYGFDVLVDNDLKPWLLEVNLCPSMKADSPLDWKVKSSLLADVFNLIGVSSPDASVMAESRTRTRVLQAALERRKDVTNFGGASPTPGPRLASAPAQRRRSTAPGHRADKPRTPPLHRPVPLGKRPVDLDRLSEGQLRMLLQAMQEAQRCRNFIRLHPTRHTIERYLPIWDAKGPRGVDFSESFRLSQSGAARLLAAVMLGEPPIGEKVGPCSRFRHPMSQGEMDPSDEADAFTSKKKKSMHSLDSATTDVPSSRGSSGSRSRSSDESPRVANVVRVFKHGLPEAQRQISKTYSTVPSLPEAQRQISRTASSPSVSRTPSPPDSSKSGKNLPGVSGESGAIATDKNGLRPLQRPLLLLEGAARAAARAAMQSASRSDTPSQAVVYRSKSTPVLPTLQPLRSRTNGTAAASQNQWIPTDNFARAPQQEALAPVLVGKLRCVQQLLSLEAIASNPDVEIEL